MPKILFVVSEAHPLIKTGGLADVAGSLTAALATLRGKLGMWVKLIAPGLVDRVARNAIEVGR